jgi:hypothetical protein
VLQRPERQAGVDPTALTGELPRTPRPEQPPQRKTLTAVAADATALGEQRARHADGQARISPGKPPRRAVSVAGVAGHLERPSGSRLSQTGQLASASA